MAVILMFMGALRSWLADDNAKILLPEDRSFWQCFTIKTICHKKLNELARLKQFLLLGRKTVVPQLTKIYA